MSSFICIFSSRPSLEASAEYSRAFARQVTVWVMSRLMSWAVYFGGVWPRIRMGRLMPPCLSSRASSRQDTAR